MDIRKIARIIIFTVISISVILPLIYWSFIRIDNKTNGEIISGSENRKYLIHVPKSYNADKAVPLVLCFHGFAEWPVHQMETSGWNDLSDREGFIVVYPEGTGFPMRWRTHGMPGNNEAEDPQKDIAFISELIDHLKSKYRIDSKKIFVNGLSNGGGISHLLACRLSDRVAAMAGVAGAYTLDEIYCKPSRPVPVIAFHGTADQIVPYRGGKSRQFTFPDIDAWASSRAVKNACMDKKISKVTAHVTLTEYKSCSANADVSLYTIDGGGHTWPGGKPMPEFITGTTTGEINATELIWEFFKKVNY